MNSNIPRRRKSSNPFIAGDSFLHISDIVILSNYSETETKTAFIELKKSTNKRKTLFVEASYLEQGQNFECFSNLASLNKEELKRNTNLIIHNGDAIPNVEQFALIVQCFDSVFSVNANDDLAGVDPLPIGLENRHHKRNGIGRELFLDRENVFRVNSKENKMNRVFSSFSISTNFEERSKLQRLLREYGFEFVNPNLKPSSYRREVLKSQFVLSPPGNGIDCHRTWEAMYLGAIPVVLEKHLHKNLIDRFPIHAIDSWEKFLQKSDSEMDSIIDGFDGRTFPALHIEFWRTIIQNGQMR